MPWSEKPTRSLTLCSLAARDWALQSWTFLGCLTGFALLAYYVAGYSVSSPYQFRVTGALVEALIVLGLAAWNCFLYQREQKMTLYELTDRATTIIHSLEHSGMNMVQVSH